MSWGCPVRVACTIMFLRWDGDEPVLILRKGEGFVIIVGVVDALWPALVIGTPRVTMRGPPPPPPPPPLRLFGQKWGTDAAMEDLCRAGLGAFFAKSGTWPAGLGGQIAFGGAGGRAEKAPMYLIGAPVPIKVGGRRLLAIRRAMSTTYFRDAQTIGTLQSGAGPWDSVGRNPITG